MSKKLSKNMQRAVARKAIGQAYLASPEYEQFVALALDLLESEGRTEEELEAYLDSAFKQPVKTRMRRGKLVEIPEEWQGVVTYPQTIRKRQSKRKRKNRKD